MPDLPAPYLTGRFRLPVPFLLRRDKLVQPGFELFQVFGRLVGLQAAETPQEIRCDAAEILHGPSRIGVLVVAAAARGPVPRPDTHLAWGKRLTRQQGLQLNRNASDVACLTQQGVSRNSPCSRLLQVGFALGSKRCLAMTANNAGMEIELFEHGEHLLSGAP